MTQVKQFVNEADGFLVGLDTAAASLAQVSSAFHGLAAEAAKPWWLQGFSRWPWIARILFLAMSAGLLVLGIGVLSAVLG